MALIGWSARASVGAEVNTGDRSAAGNTGTSSVPEVRKLTTSSKSPPSYTPLIQLGSMGIAHAIGRRMTIRVTRSQTNRAVPFISVAILTSRSWVVSTPTPRLRSPFADPGVILTRVWSQSGFSPTVLHGLPHYASGKAAILDGRIILDEDPFWPDGAPAPRTPLLSCAALPEAATGITMTPVSVSAHEDPRRLVASRRSRREVGTFLPVSSKCILSTTAHKAPLLSHSRMKLGCSCSDQGARAASRWSALPR